jgi:hypothetical protein
MTTKYINSTTGSDSGTTGPFKSLEYALESGGMAFGDTLILQGSAIDLLKVGTNNYIQTSIASGTAAPLTIIAEELVCTITIPVGASVQTFRFGSGSTVDKYTLFSGITFSDSGGVGVEFFSIRSDQGTQYVRFYSCIFDSFIADMFFINDLNAASSTLFRRCRFTNWTRTKSAVRNNCTQVAPVVSFETCYFETAGRIYSESGTTLNDISMTNCTVTDWPEDVPGADRRLFSMSGISTTSFVLKNNIFDIKNPSNTNFIFDGNSRPSTWTVENNAIWVDGVLTSSDFLNRLFEADDDHLILDSTNIFIDPDLTSGEIATTGNALYIHGRGDNAALPDSENGDIDGTAWNGSDIGCYANQFASQRLQLVTNTALISGDSIASGDDATTVANRCYSKLQSDYLTDYIVLDGSTWNLAGLKDLGIFLNIDRAIVTEKPRNVVVLGPTNNLPSTGIKPANASAADIADTYEQIGLKVKAWGCTVSFVGPGAVVGANESEQTTNPLDFSSAMEIIADDNNWGYESLLVRMMDTPTWADPNVYYVDITSNVHPDDDGHDLIAEISYELIKSLIKTDGWGSLKWGAGNWGTTRWGQ